jgi:hypothetical protein
VYALAQIPAPQPPQTLPAPGKPNEVGITLLASGALTISWKAENASASTGGLFQVYRKLPGQAGFTSIGGAPGSTSLSRTMSFTDNTVPTSAAAAGVQYQIQGQRNGLFGPASDAIVVQFGTDTPGGLSVSGATGMKMAA